MIEHELKCWPVYFDAINRGEKNFEVRRDDRGFQKGDVVVLQRTVQDKYDGVIVERSYDGKAMYVVRKRIAYILTGGQFGIEPGYVVMALEDITP